MGIRDFAIATNHPFNKYSPGQTVRGKVHFTLEEPQTVRGIYVKLKGRAKVSWVVRHGKSSTTYHAEQEYFNDRIYFAGANGGDHDYKFQYDLPDRLPSTFKGSHGKIEYTVKAVLDIPFALDDEEETILDISPPLNRIDLPQLKKPYHREAQKNLCFGCQSGAIILEVHLEKTGYAFGELIPIKLDLENGSNSNITKVKCKLKKVITYRSEHPSERVRDEETVLCEKQFVGVAERSSKTYENSLTIPNEKGLNFDNCRCLQVEYILQVIVIISGCHRDMDTTIPLILGTAGVDPNQCNLHVNITQGLGTPYPYELGQGDARQGASKEFHDN